MHHAELVQRIGHLGVVSVEVHHLGEVLACLLRFPLGEMQLAKPVVAVWRELPIRIGFDHLLEGLRGLIKRPVPHQVEGSRVGLLLGFGVPRGHVGGRRRTVRRRGARCRIARTGRRFGTAQRHQALVEITVLGLLVLGEALDLKPELLHHPAQGLKLALQDLQLMEQWSNAAARAGIRRCECRLRASEGLYASRRGQVIRRDRPRHRRPLR